MILSVVKHGYCIPFFEQPSPFFAKNNRSSLNNRGFVEKSILELLENNCIKEVKSPSYCVNPLSVAERNGKKRLVIDLRHINKHLSIKKFKYENLKIVSELFEKDFVFCTFDLKSGYHHVQIHDDHQKFLGFCWTFEDNTTVKSGDSGQFSRFFKHIFLLNVLKAVE